MLSETWESEIIYPYILTGYGHFVANWSESIDLRKDSSSCFLTISNLQWSLVDNYTIGTDFYEVGSVQETQDLFSTMCHQRDAGRCGFSIHF